MTCDGAAYVVMGFITQGWMAFLLMQLFAIGGTANPILTALLSDRVDADNQGALMGLIASMTRFVSIFAPPTISLIFFASRNGFPGLVWVLAAATYLVCLPFLLGAISGGKVVLAV